MSSAVRRGTEGALAGDGQKNGIYRILIAFLELLLCLCGELSCVEFTSRIMSVDIYLSRTVFCIESKLVLS